jgi:hypothetical protein
MSDKPLFNGLTVTGTYMGTRVNHGKPDQNGQTKETLYCGIAFHSEGRYGELVETVMDVMISKNLIQKGIPAKLAAFNGKQVTLPVFVTPWSNGKGTTTFLGNDVEQLFNPQQVKAAS